MNRRFLELLDRRHQRVEIGGALKYDGPIYAMLGATTGANDGIGAPEIRFFFQLGFTFPMGDDEDEGGSEE